MNIGILGHKGRVGKLLIRELLDSEHPNISLAGGYEHKNEGDNTSFFTTNDLNKICARADALIDFTHPDAVPEHIKHAQTHKKAYILGTTGLSKETEEQLNAASKDIPILYAANMSVGVNVLLALVEKASEILNDTWDIEIFESHHKHKIDAPSGTALAIGKAAAKGRGVSLNDVSAHARHGQTGARKQGDIGFSVARGGDVVGEHVTYFYGDGERIELNHIATNRALFAKGAIKGALWLGGQKPGLYSMRDVLGL